MDSVSEMPFSDIDEFLDDFLNKIDEWTVPVIVKIEQIKKFIIYAFLNPNINKTSQEYSSEDILIYENINFEFDTITINEEETGVGINLDDAKSSRVIDNSLNKSKIFKKKWNSSLDQIYLDTTRDDIMISSQYLKNYLCFEHLKKEEFSNILKDLECEGYLLEDSMDEIYFRKLLITKKYIALYRQQLLSRIKLYLMFISAYKNNYNYKKMFDSIKNRKSGKKITKFTKNNHLLDCQQYFEQIIIRQNIEIDNIPIKSYAFQDSEIYNILFNKDLFEKNNPKETEEKKKIEQFNGLRYGYLNYMDEINKLHDRARETSVPSLLLGGSDSDFSFSDDDEEEQTDVSVEVKQTSPVEAKDDEPVVEVIPEEEQLLNSSCKKIFY